MSGIVSKVVYGNICRWEGEKSHDDVTRRTFLTSMTSHKESKSEDGIKNLDLRALKVRNRDRKLRFEK